MCALRPVPLPRDRACPAPSAARECRAREPARRAGPVAVSVLSLTIFVGFVLVGFFVALFLIVTASSRPAGPRDALLPLEDDTRPGPR